MTRNTFKRPLVRLLIVGVSLLAVVSLSRTVYTLWGKRDYVRLRADALAREQAENDRLKKQVEEAKKSEFIEKEAREKLGMTREGESIVIMPQITQSDQSDQLNMTQEKDESNWRKWWRLFF